MANNKPMTSIFIINGFIFYSLDVLYNDTVFLLVKTWSHIVSVVSFPVDQCNNNVTTIYTLWSSYDSRQQRFYCPIHRGG